MLRTIQFFYVKPNQSMVYAGKLWYIY